MKRKMIGVFVLAFVVLAAFSIPQGFAKSSNLYASGRPTNYQRTNIRGVSNAASASPSASPASCGDLGFNGKFGTVTFTRWSLVARVQHVSPNSQYSVWLGYKTGAEGCDGSWQQLGKLNTNDSGNGGYAQSLTLNSDTQYQVVLRDVAGTTIYATAFFSP